MKKLNKNVEHRENLKEENRSKRNFANLVPSETIITV
jgi:hypothetical protein